MNKIKELFDPTRNIYRSIEKVVTFGSMKPEALNREISEYIVTNNLRSSFEKILDALHSGMESDSHEIGIWVSGFYGSGKSSFAKYFGLSLQKNLIIDGTSFQERLANRINSNKITQQLKTLIQKYDPQIFLIDLATQQISGYNLAPVSTIIYHEVMKWAGYATDEKIALLERKLEMDGKLTEFKKLVTKEKNEDWDKIKIEDKLTAKAISQEYAPRFYPNIWKDAKSYNITKLEDIENDKERTTQMLTLIKTKSGKENVLFIIDEVGQYVSAKDELILQLQGTLENLKDLGNGKAWLLATAQQTLTEDNPNARFNSDKLYKLNDRFPIKIDIEASDIKEITTKRLLGKSSEGEEILKKLYSKHGEMLRLNARLSNVEKTIYKAELDERSFIDLYPFLPYHFNILLSLLARLAKKTGGIGLRSAIRVIQDVLTESTGDKLAEDKIGALATTAHIYNVLKSDIRKSYPHIYSSVEKVIGVYNEKSPEAFIAKTIATLQILDDFYLSIENLAVMMHPSVDAPSQVNELKIKIQGIKNTKGLTLKEIDGQLRFMTDAIIRIEEEKEKIFVSGAATRKVYENQIEDIFSPVPGARIANTKAVKTGIQFVLEERINRLLEPNEEIQTEIQFVQKAKYEKALEELKHKSTEKLNENKIYCLGALDEPLDNTLEEIVRCEEIANNKHHYDDKEINDYLNSQFQDATTLKGQVKRKLISSIENGEFVFRGTSKAAKQIGEGYREALNSWLKTCAEKVYYKYNQAPVTVEPATVQRLLQIDDLRSTPSTLNAFNIIKTDGSIDIDMPSVKSIEDYLQNEGQVDGRKILEHFSGAPFGWHKDTTRYLISVIFLASIVKLKINGESVKVKGPSAIEKLSTSTAFTPIGISLHKEGQPTDEQKLKAAANLTELTGSLISPLPQKISETVIKYFPEFLNRYADLRFRLVNLNLPGVDKAETIQEGITEILKGDASDATFRLGKEDAELYLALKWAKKVYEAFANGIEETVKKIRNIQGEIETLLDTGLPGELKIRLTDRFEEINRILQSDNFYEKASDLNDYNSEIDNIIADTCLKFQDQENELINIEIANLKSSYAWTRLNSEQKQEFSIRFENALIKDKSGIKGIKEIINEVFTFNNLIKTVEREIKDTHSVAEPDSGFKTTKQVVLSHLPKRIENKGDLEIIIKELNKLKNGFKEGEIITLEW